MPGLWPPSAVHMLGRGATRLRGRGHGQERSGQGLTAAHRPTPSSSRYYFKKVSDEFDCGVVFEEVREDEAVLPVFEEKIIGKVEKVD